MSGGPIQRSINLAPSNFFQFGAFAIGPNVAPQYLAAGGQAGVPTTTAGVNAIAAPRPGLIKTVTLYAFAGPSGGTALVQVFVNGILTELMGTWPDALGAPSAFQVTLPSVATPPATNPTTNPVVATGDVIEIGITYPAGVAIVNINAILELE